MSAANLLDFLDLFPNIHAGKDVDLQGSLDPTQSCLRVLSHFEKNFSKE
jgi:hypothetical protein